MVERRAESSEKKGGRRPRDGEVLQRAMTDAPLVLY